MVGARYHLATTGSRTVWDVPHTIWEALLECWNRQQTPPEERDKELQTVSLVSDGS